MQFVKIDAKDSTDKIAEASWIQKVATGQKDAIFKQTAANFRQRRLRVLKIFQLCS